MIEQFEKALDENPQDFELRAVFSDWLEENKKDDAAKCQRWMIEYWRYPWKKIYSQTLIWQWYFWDFRPRSHYSIPEYLSIKMTANKCGPFRYYHTRKSAELDLQRALKEIGYGT
jgi:uncharacterized protein (TIGR02996 family)